jgi:hypothetical protein
METILLHAIDPDPSAVIQGTSSDAHRILARVYLIRERLSFW